MASPEDEKSDSTLFAIITTRTERSNRHYRTQRSYESGCVGSSAEDEIQRSVKYTSNQLGEVNDNMGDESVEHYCQETDKDSTACFTVVRMFDPYMKIIIINSYRLVGYIILMEMLILRGRVSCIRMRSKTAALILK